MNNYNEEKASNNEIDVKAIIKLIWKEKWLVLALSSVISLSTLIYAINQPNIYKSEALLFPNENSVMNNSLSQISAQFGGLAQMAGISANVGSENKTQVAISKLRSFEFFKDYIYEDIIIELMAGKEWDPISKEIIIDKKIFDEKNKKWIRQPSKNKRVKPSPQEVFVEYKKIVFVIKDRLSGFVTIRVEYISPFFVKRLADLIVFSINESMKINDIRESKNSIDFLIEQQQRTSLISLDGVFSSLIEEQTKKMMLANVSEEYIYTLIDPPIIPENKIRPGRAIMCITGSILGGIFSIIFVLTRRVFIDRKISIRRLIE